jgi:glycosyltransferase involved in cell wall biosynthesis
LVGFDAPYFLVVGQYAPYKRHDLALSAFAEHVPEPWRLIFVQRQTRRAPLADLADKLGVADRVSWFSHLELGDLIQLYQAASGLVQPSLYEGFGIPLLEAMACGCPVVATDMPMFREVLGPAGLLVGKNGSDGFGQALASLAKSEGWRNEVSEAGIERAAQFSWDRCAESTLHVLRNAAGGVSSATARTHAAV